MLVRFLVTLLTLPLTEAAGDGFTDSISPFVTKYCVECHNRKVHKGELDLTRYANNADVTDNFRRWNNIVEFIRNGEMPPKDAKQPSIDERNAVIAHVEEILLVEAIKHAGDPGIVLPRRLSNTEYDMSIRDLTGVEIRPTKDFPADPAGGEGFDNTGEALGTSPNLVKKYLAAAEHVANHLVLMPSGISFAPFPVTSYNERKKLTEIAIIEFYERHDVYIDQYLDAAWRYRYRGGDRQDLTIEHWARDRGISGKYLSLVCKTLSDASVPSGFMKEIIDAWNAIPAPASETNRPSEFQTLRDVIAFGRRVLPAPEGELIKANAGNWPISHLDFRAKKAAVRDKFDRSALKNETLLSGIKIAEPKNGVNLEPYSVFLRVDSAFSDGDNFVVVKRPLFSNSDQLPKNKTDEEKQLAISLRSVLERSNSELITALGFGKHPRGDDINPDWFVVQAPALIEIALTTDMQRELAGKHLLLPVQLDSVHSPNGSVIVQSSAQKVGKSRFEGNAKHLIFGESNTAKKLAESAEVFCHAFPNRFFYVDEVRGLAAGFHLVEGFFRDDQPLVKKVLNDAECSELDRLWQELEFVTESAETLLRGFVWFERSEREVLHDKRFNFLRSEDPQLVEASLLNKFEKLYLDKMGIKRIGDTLDAESPEQKYAMIHGFFEQIRSGLLQQQELNKLAEKRALEDIKQLATRAFRHPLRSEEYDALIALYRKLREDGQSVEAAARGVLIAVLMSPSFCYHQTTRPAGEGIHSLNDYDLASRLGFFLWSSVPDDELLAAAKAGRLQSDHELVSQTRRMLKDEKISAFSGEFFGQWLRYRDYLAKDPIYSEAFPGYTEELRFAMFEEPQRLATHLIQTDQSIMELLASDMTFVNRVLAKHYGGELEAQYREAATSNQDQSWHAVNGLRKAGRGGLLGMAVILTKNSAGERTSPVKRGFWSVHHLLGQHFPPPPADVPKLPASEKGAEATIRELLSAHVSDAQCAMCHSHFDSLGLAMEGFDAIGRSRTKDSGGRQIDNGAILPNGETAMGISGLIEYIQHHRRNDFVRTLCRKFLGYALGRSVELSDQPLIDRMDKTLRENDFRFSVLFEEVVRSRQFRNQRGTGSQPVAQNR